MDDWNDCDKDDGQLEVERRERELRRVEQKFKNLGIEKGMESIAGQESPQVQAAFDGGFTQTMQPAFMVTKAFSRLKSLQHVTKFLPRSTAAVDPDVDAALERRYKALLSATTRNEIEEEAFIKDCDRLFMQLSNQLSAA